MARVDLLGVRKSYGDVEVVHGVDLSIADGEFVALVGPSGCGKSTLLRMLAGLEPVTSGEIRIGGSRVNELQPKDRDIAMVFQNYALYPHKNVRANMGFSLRLRGVAADEISTRVDAAAETLGLSQLLERYPRQLSGGQRQRVAMGRAIVRDPKVFLFDEPLSNLDAKLRVQMRTEIKALHQRLRTTAIYVTHDQIEAMTMADRIVVLQNGRVEQVGSPLELYDRPVNRFVAGFIGSPAMNLLPGKIENNGIILDGGAMVSGSGAVPERARGRDVLLGIRPEHLAMSSGPGLESVVEVVEPTGIDTFVLFSLNGKNVAGVFRDRIALSPGAKVSLSFDPQKAHVFDANTGRRLDGYGGGASVLSGAICAGMA
ncbi:MAG TPA: sn-glycerol-3-phosphate ABC transporter ATP-binding protein UgpC [Bradyrhizobium sp.]|nr:sn-glycerol-3-phosphate ABC transporter ATP-binding protein UgpC [Bradyrhizobium sp.]